METLIAVSAAPVAPQIVAEQLIPLSKSKGGKPVVLASLLHQFLEIGSRPDKWFGRRVEEYGFVQGVDYERSNLGENEAADYFITLDMAKELAMVERNEKGQQARRYFIACEKRLRTISEGPQLPNFSNPADAARAWANEFEAKQQALAVAQQVQQQLVEAKPKIEFFDKVAVSINSISFEDAAKWLKLPGLEGRNKLIKRLKEDKILQKNRSPYQRYIDEHYFEVEAQAYQAGEKGKRLASTTRVTPKGLDWLLKKYKS
ncbi:phage antirepressor KilAC domain-containing protein [Hymenobacter sp. BRD128]|uniref:phage antirepressor KilAC domain-containing protein n=1 Tax=Hymenobacter sp. BRD128 TaxID=2675878 RepID=UPI00156720AD|nr:phage antirepressor KilAC domain-containing protein [Hymenobacter sp. BRD128]QKG56979.1 phage antirepressor KilAC domain-containing protein [Hymenobacter sp. BRD128]